MKRSNIVRLGFLSTWAVGLVTPAFPEPPVCVPGAAGRFDIFVDGDVDGDDHAVLAACLSGPGKTPAPPRPMDPALCLQAFDVDDDEDVDIADARWFFQRYTGACRGIGDCPDGWHLIHRSGVIGVPDPDTFEESEAEPSDYTCERDESCQGVVCLGHGACQVHAGIAVCACERGYAGASCERCAVGYERDGKASCVLGPECRERLCSAQGTCRDTGLDIVCDCDQDASGRFCEDGGGDPSTLRPPTRVVITGTDVSIPVETCVELTARSSGGGAIATDFRWTLTGLGRLDTTAGTQVTYCAPDIVSDAQIARIDICTNSFPDNCATRYLTIDPPGGIPAAGNSNTVFDPVDDAVRTFMRHRCIGGAVLGISWFGKTVHLRGFGNLAGAPTNDPDYLAACCDTWDISDHIPGLSLPSPAPVQPSTPMRVGSISKSVTGAVLRKIVKEQVFGDANTSDDDVEDALLCATDLDLIPVDVRNILCFGVPGPPVPLPDSGDNSTFCPNLVLSADSRWQNVTLGHFLGHATGMLKSAPDTESTTMPNLASVRDLFGQSDWEADEIAMLSQTGFPAGNFINEFPDYLNAKTAIDPGYFVPRATVFEVLKVVLGRCLKFTPGSSTQYSNTGFNVLSAIIEHITGGSYAGRSGRPGLHSGSALHAFLTQDLGTPLPGQQTPGIFYSDDVFRLRNPAEPIYRTWSAVQKTYYKLVNDNKRPHCRWTGNTCDFSEWLDGDLRFDWDFHEEQTILGYNESPGASTGGTGGLAVEPEVFLRFMANYWVEGEHKTDPSYGETRCPGGNCIWTLPKSHNGARTTAYAEAWQLGGTKKTKTTCVDDPDCGSYTVCNGTPQAYAASEKCLGGLCRRLNEYSIPPLNSGTGDITDAFEDIECRACELPVGVDFFIAVNQREDCKCRQAEDLCDDHPRRYTCGSAYKRLRGYVLHGICQVNFPPNPYVVWPPVSGGGSSMSKLVTQPEAELNVTPEVYHVPYEYRGPELSIAGGACCGNDVKDPGEDCDGTDFGTQSCSDFGHNMGSLRCTEVCSIDATDCSGGMGGPPASYDACGFTDCQDPSDPNCTLGGDAGRCLGGPCRQTDPGDFAMALFDPLNQSGGRFHADGDFRDDASGNLFFCYDDTRAGEMVCVDEGGWGVCKQCATGSEFSTRIGCTCNTVSDCDLAEPGLSCFGEDSGGGPGFCYDAHDGPPAWQCEEATCGMTTYPEDAMYCEHYSLSGKARCEPWFACNSILARVCADQNLICGCQDEPPPNNDGACDDGANGCTDSNCCGVECTLNSECGQSNGWPAGYTCSPQLECVGP